MACEASIKMHKALKKLNEERKKEAEQNNSVFLELKIGIGINTGNCVVGNMGSEQRFDYSVLGDSVNLASRLEGQSKGYGVKTIIGSETYETLKNEFAILKLDLIAVKGKKEAVAIYTLLGNNELKNQNSFKDLELKHNLMLNSYFNQNWLEASLKLKECENLLNWVRK